MHPTSNRSLTPNSTQKSEAQTPLSLLKSGQLLYLHPKSRGSLILQKKFYADWVNAGAAVGGCFDLDCKAIYVLGEVNFCVPHTYDARATAFRQRITCIECLQSILREPSSFRRAQLTISQLSRGLGFAEIQQIPHESIAQLAGIHPKTVQMCWKNYAWVNPKKVVRNPSVEEIEPSLIV
ncbi:hypothetical protein IQ249_21235 [Lusitaniella coriacea LEGE 07157]|uniref:Uncharacterized protein n=1 Tax=Lusitaniella coriacea LEGE 07157 TaxID=945747 RepID=A0A8J7DZD0_9CYAN|nr:hypothetical protein [Lusitaniella coriacea]MBE9118419.1 hypothetical protein [Lusitaniella coriacea LEGE 07157]